MFLSIFKTTQFLKYGLIQEVFKYTRHFNVGTRADGLESKPLFLCSTWNTSRTLAVISPQAVKLTRELLKIFVSLSS